MNYIELINWFWICDEVHSFNSKETRLYFYLLKVANSLHWQESFWHSDSKTAGNVGFTVNTLKSARNKLKNTGLIDFKSGGNGYGDKSRYQILTPKSIPKVEPTLEPRPQPKSIPKVEPLNKHKPNEKENKNNISKSHSETDVSVIEKIENLKTENFKEKNSVKKDSGGDQFFKQFVSVWFEFYESKFSFKPTFGAVDGSKAKSIITKLKSKATEKGFEWNLEILENSTRKLFELAYSNKWLSENFRLSVIDSQFDSIIAKTVKNGQQNNSTAVNDILANWQ